MPTAATGLQGAEIANDADPRTLALDGVHRIELNFPKFTDGRAFSQAFLLRRRLGFTGEIRATGDVLIDQLVQMQRTGFDVGRAARRPGPGRMRSASSTASPASTRAMPRSRSRLFASARSRRMSAIDLNARASADFDAKAGRNRRRCCSRPRWTTPR